MANKIDLGTIITILSFIFALIVGGLYFGYNEWYKTPKLTYEILDKYPLNKDIQITPIIVRNEGHEKATNVRISMDASGIIQDIEIKSPEEIHYNIKNNNTFVADLTRIAAESEIIFYMKVETQSKEPINNILIVSDQVSGSIHEKTYDIYGSLGLILGILSVSFCIVFLGLFFYVVLREVLKIR